VENLCDDPVFKEMFSQIGIDSNMVKEDKETQQAIYDFIEKQGEHALMKLAITPLKRFLLKIVLLLLLILFSCLGGVDKVREQQKQQQEQQLQKQKTVRRSGDPQRQARGPLPPTPAVPQHAGGPGGVPPPPPSRHNRGGLPNVPSEPPPAAPSPPSRGQGRPSRVSTSCQVGDDHGKPPA
jgi:hypothetical protein